ncbi:hypothetical protein [Streptomyces sp. NPDC058572]|uniref:hypothetical protein n=1 Tax=Streptomyces sp. NPDC058572 TaxID=3346546 RepID=UPI00365621CA
MRVKTSRISRLFAGLLAALALTLGGAGIASAAGPSNAAPSNNYYDGCRYGGYGYYDDWRYDRYSDRFDDRRGFYDDRRGFYRDSCDYPVVIILR